MAIRRIAGERVANDAIAAAARRRAQYDGRLNSAPNAAARVRAKADHLAAELRHAPAELALTVSATAIADMERLIAALVPTGAQT